MISIGWTPLNSEGTPHRPTKNENHRWRKPFKMPVRIYTTEGRAKDYSPVGKAAEVFMEAPE